MDGIDITGKIKELFSKYKHVLLILCAGIILMQLPERVITEPQSVAISETPESPATKVFPSSPPDERYIRSADSEPGVSY